MKCLFRKSIYISIVIVLYAHTSLLSNEIILQDTLKYSQIDRTIDEVRVTSTPSHQNIAAIPGSISIISPEELDVGQQLDIRPYLEHIPGINMQAGALNTARLTVRGIGSRTPYATNRVKAYYDDIPLTSGDGATIIEDIEISEIGRVEVIKGPSSTLYGPGLGGTILLRPAPIAYGTHSSVLLEGDSFDLLRAGGSVSYMDTTFFVRVSAYRTRTDGHRENSQYKRSNFTARAGAERGRNYVSFLINHVDLNAQIPSSLDYDTYIHSPQSAAANWLSVAGFQAYSKWQGGISINSELNNRWSNRLSLFGVYNDAYESRPFNILDELTQTAGLRQRVNYSHGIISLSFGTELFREQYKWRIYETDGGIRGELEVDNNDLRHYQNIFAHSEFSLESGTSITAGINFHWLSYRVDELGSDSQMQNHQYPLIISPRLGLSQRVFNDTYLMASVGHGFSAPSSEEALLPDGTINRQLKPEEGINLEGGIRSSLFSNSLDLEITTYRMWVRNLLMTRRDAEDIFYGENAGRTIHTGLESRLIYRLNSTRSSKYHTISLAHSLMDNRFTYFIQDEADFSNNQHPGIPYSNLSVNLMYQVTKTITLGSNFNHTSSQYLNDSNSLKYSGHEIIDLTVAYSKRIRLAHEFKAIAGIQNILDTHHASMVLVNAPTFGSSPPRYYYPGKPRTFFVTLKLNFQTHTN